MTLKGGETGLFADVLKATLEGFYKLGLPYKVMLVLASVLNFMAMAYVMWVWNEPSASNEPSTSKASTSESPPKSKSGSNGKARNSSPSVFSGLESRGIPLPGVEYAWRGPSSSPSPSPSKTQSQAQLDAERQRVREWTAAVLPPQNSPSKSQQKPKARTSQSPARRPAAAARSTSPTHTHGPLYEVGQTVLAAYRSLPGEPVRPGGEGRITAVTKSNIGWTYGIAYYQGGRELSVLEKFISSETSLTDTGGGLKKRVNKSNMVVEAQGLKTPTKSKAR